MIKALTAAGQLCRAVVQVLPAHNCLTEDPQPALDDLVERLATNARGRRQSRT